MHIYADFRHNQSTKYTQNYFSRFEFQDKFKYFC